MVGPFMQGMLLMGIIYMYSKGLMNLINDYYRGEINRKLKSELNEHKMSNMKPQTYDLSDMDQLVNIEITKENILKEELTQQQLKLLEKDENYLDLSYLNETNNCYRLSRKQEFLNILFSFVYNYYKMHPLKNPICRLNEYYNRNYTEFKENFETNAVKGI